jgi:ubiquinone/menaquinone biosynthesis C-methylase UbiE
MTSGEVRLGHFGLGIAGLGLLRQWMDPANAPVRTDEVRLVLSVLDDDTWSPVRRPTEHDVVTGYARWATVYDSMDNGLIDIEEPALRELLGGPVEPGASVAVDAACGTGRVSRLLADLGYDVRGVDATPEMLERARAKVPPASFEVGGLEALPFADGTADLTTCCLALTHLADAGPAVAELARVTKPGGRVVISDFHPFAHLTGGAAAFPGDEGEAPFVTSHFHPIGEQLAQFAAAGLSVLRCVEPVVDPALPSMVPPPLLDAARAAFGGAPFAILWELRRA